MKLRVTACALVLAAALAGGAEAANAPVGMTLKPVSSCAPRTAMVQRTSGTVEKTGRVTPGPRLVAVGRSTQDLFLLGRVDASWQRFLRPPGQVLRLTAVGPRGETWRWAFGRVSQADPVVDSSSYLVCLHPLAPPRASFVRRMRANPGLWRFTLTIVQGRLAGSSASAALRARS